MAGVFKKAFSKFKEATAAKAAQSNAPQVGRSSGGFTTLFPDNNTTKRTQVPTSAFSPIKSK